MSVKARDPAFEARVRDSFARQNFMGTLGAELTAVRPGEVEIRLPFNDGLTQQHGYFHGGVIGTMADNAAGYAAFTLVRAEDTLLTAEYKINLVSPGDGDALRAHGTVLKPGRRLSIVDVKVYIEKNGIEKLCATALATMMILENTSDERKA